MPIYTRSACAIALLVALTTAARASSFTVNPIRIDLDAASKTGLLTVRNDGSQPLRIQITAFAWSQSASGEVQLAASKDVVAFPTLVEIAPGAEKKIRVGVKTAPALVEKTYRVFVEELPGLQTPGTTTEVRVLTKFGVPIFVAPTKIARDVRVGRLAIAGGRLAFGVENAGTVSAIVKTVKISAVGENRDVLYAHEESGWYVLGGSARTYAFELPVERCAQTAKLTIEVVTDQGAPITSALAMPAGGCRR